MNRIKELREENNITQEDLAKKLNLSSRGIVSMYEKEERKPSLEILIKLSEIFNCSIDYLLGKSDIRKDNNIIELKNLYKMPVYGTISAGQPNWAVECLEGFLPIDPNLMGILNPQECFFLRVNGESMNKIIRNGAYALIRKQDFINNGEIAVVLVNGLDATLKKFTKQNDLVLLEPQSTDSTFTTQVYDKNTDIKILGKYIGKFEIND